MGGRQAFNALVNEIIDHNSAFIDWFNAKTSEEQQSILHVLSQNENCKLHIIQDIATSIYTYHRDNLVVVIERIVQQRKMQAAIERVVIQKEELELLIGEIVESQQSVELWFSAKSDPDKQLILSKLFNNPSINGYITLEPETGLYKISLSTETLGYSSELQRKLEEIILDTSRVVEITDNEGHRKNMSITREESGLFVVVENGVK